MEFIPCYQFDSFWIAKIVKKYNKYEFMAHKNTRSVRQSAERDFSGTLSGTLLGTYWVLF